MPHFTEFAEEYLKDRKPDHKVFAVYEHSVYPVNNGLIYMADAGADDVLVASHIDVFEGERVGAVTIARLTHANANALRSLVPFTAPSKVLSRDQSCGVGDRLGIAVPGHLRVFENCSVAPVLAQQSMRELSLTNRTYEDVVDAATFSVFRAGFKTGFGADGDHLKNAVDIQTALKAGCSMITLDCSDHIKPVHQLEPDAAMDEEYLNKTFNAEGEPIHFTRQELNEARAVYGEAIAFAKEMYDRFFAGGDAPAELEISIDETKEATSPQQHFFIAS